MSTSSLPPPSLSLSLSLTHATKPKPNPHKTINQPPNRTVVSVAGDGYVILAASTRLSTGYSILSREATKVCRLSEGVLVANAGFAGDGVTLQKVLKSRAVAYQHAHRRPMPVHAAAQLLGNTLYYKRFFPYYAFCLCAGLDEENKGAVYTYDAVGSHERVGFSCQGSGKDLIQPVLDNQLKSISPLALPAGPWKTTPLPKEEAVDLVKSAFVAAGERDIYTGDSVQIFVLTKEGLSEEVLELKKD